MQHRRERLLERQLDRAEVGRVLRLRVEADRTTDAFARMSRQVDDLFERRDLEPSVKRGTGRSKLWKPLARPKGSQLVDREVLGEPAGQHNAVDHLRRSTVRELGMGGDVRRATDLVLVPRDEHAVFRRHHVGLDEIGTLLDRQRVARERVLGPVPDAPRWAMTIGWAAGSRA